MWKKLFGKSKRDKEVSKSVFNFNWIPVRGPVNYFKYPESDKEKFIDTQSDNQDEDTFQQKYDNIYKNKGSSKNKHCSKKQFETIIEEDDNVSEHDCLLMEQIENKNENDTEISDSLKVPHSSSINEAGAATEEITDERASSSMPTAFEIFDTIIPPIDFGLANDGRIVFRPDNKCIRARRSKNLTHLYE